MKKYSDLFVSRAMCCYDVQDLDCVLSIAAVLAKKFPFLEKDDVVVMLRSVDGELLHCLADCVKEVSE